MRAGQPTGCGIRLRVYGVRLATVPSDQGYQLVTDEEGNFVPTGEQYRIPKASAAPVTGPRGCQESGRECADPDSGPDPNPDPDPDRGSAQNLTGS